MFQNRLRLLGCIGAWLFLLASSKPSKWTWYGHPKTQDTAERRMKEEEGRVRDSLSEKEKKCFNPRY
eukprot:scaffold37850_cov226-Skeletonema_marinoi.AAC.2